MIFVATDRNGNEIVYRDRKRYLWVLSVLSPAIPGVSALILLSGGAVFWAGFPVFFYYFCVPFLDALLGEDFSNPPEEVVEALSNDPYYRALLHLSVPVFFGSFFLSAIAIGTLNLPVWAFLALTLGTGAASGSGLTVGHELGHKHSPLDRFSAKIITSLTGYSHFCIEHNHGHHVLVATPEDPTSARFNESIYSFMWREIPQTATIAWDMERKRLEKRGLSFWSMRNEILQGYALAGAIAAVLIYLFGWIMLPFLILHHFVGWLQLTFANYVEHYGLKREKKENGKYVPCQPHHSWNTNHIFSNLLLFHLQRHSDHHANPMRPYQSLRDLKDLPRLPSGYPGTFLLAAVPRLWFRTMNPKVLDWAGGDLNKVNTG